MRNNQTPKNRGSIEPSKAYILQALMMLMLVICGIAVYSNTFQSPFVYDDFMNITENEYIRITDPSWESLLKILKSRETLRLLSNMTFAINYYFDQYNVTAYHIINIVIHILAGIFLFLFIKKTLTITNEFDFFLKKSNVTILQITFFATLIWMLHPVNTQSVTYIVQRMNSMAAMFYILSMFCYISGRSLQRSGLNSKSRAIPWIWFSGSLASGLLALASKQNAAMLPFFIILYEWLFFQNLRWTWTKKKIFWSAGSVFSLCIIALIYITYDTASMNLYATQTFTLLERLQTETRVIFYYISLFLWPDPDRLNLIHDYPISHSVINPPMTILSIIILISIVSIAISSFKKHKILVFCVIWFFGNLAIESSFIGLAIIFEHRTYTSFMLLSLFVTILIFRVINKKRFAIGFILAVSLFFAFKTYQRNLTWQNEIRLWEDCIDKSPNVADLYNNMGLALAKQGDNADAIVTLKEALQLDPDHVDANNNIGIAYQKNKEDKKAIFHYKKALKAMPHYIKTYCNLGRMYHEKGDFQRAANFFNKAIAINPLFAEAHDELGTILFAQNKSSQALTHFYEAIRLSPGRISTVINIGDVLASQNKFTEAKNFYNQSLKLDPDNKYTRNKLGNLYARQGDFKMAIKQYEQILDKVPDHIITLNNMGNALFALGKHAEAVSLYKKSLKADPENKNAHFNLGLVFAAINDFHRAEHQFTEALRIDPKYAEAKFNLEKLKATGSNTIISIRQQLDMDPENAALQYQLGNLYYHNDKIDLAIKQFQKTLSIDARFVKAIYHLGIIYAEQHNYPKSIEYFKMLIEIEHDNLNAHYNIACLYAKQNYETKAVEWLKKAINLGYDNWANVKTDPDLENIRDTDYYKSIIKKADK